MKKYPEECPEVVVGVLIVSKDGKIFLMSSPKFHNRWVIPGGHIERGESMQKTAEREIKEETNLEIGKIEHLIIQEGIFDPGFIRKTHFIFINVLAHAKEGKVTLNKEGTEWKWLTLKEAEALDVEPYTSKVIEMYKEKMKK
jgi:nucleoside triphosphatase